jgi:hypothetical protein
VPSRGNKLPDTEIESASPYLVSSEGREDRKAEMLISGD